MASRIMGIQINNQRGAGLIVVIVILLIVSTVGAVFVSLINTESFTAMNQSAVARVVGITEAGLDRALYQYKTGAATCSGLTNAVPTSLGDGSFTTVGTLYHPNPSNTLDVGGIPDTTSTTITLTNPPGNASYAPHGRIQVDSELIDYTAKSGANQLTGGRRGVNGTTPAIHPGGAAVLQSQCLVQSTGKISNPLPGISSTQRIVETSVATSAKQSSLTSPAATGSQIISGIGFRPKAVIFFWTNQTATGFIGNGQRPGMGVGFASGTGNQRAVAVSARDNRDPSQDDRRYSENRVIVIQRGGGSLRAEAQLTALNENDFTLNWTTTDGNAYIIHYIALGGDITQAFVSTFNLNTVVGNQDVTTVGFQPDFVMFLWSHTGALDSNLVNAEIGLGLAKDAAAQGAMVYAALDGDNNNNGKRWQQRTTDAILLLRPTVDPPDQDAVANFVTMLANGFRINISDAPTAANTRIFYLALKGGRHQVGAFTQPAVTGNQSTTGVGFRPEQLMLISRNRPVTATIDGLGAVSLGMAQFSTTTGNVWFQDRSDNDPSDANAYTARSPTTTDVITLANGNNVVTARADLLSFNRDGFTLNWTTADATARQILYWAIGPFVISGQIDRQESY